MASKTVALEQKIGSTVKTEMNAGSILYHGRRLPPEVYLKES